SLISDLLAAVDLENGRCLERSVLLLLCPLLLRQTNVLEGNPEVREEETDRLSSALGVKVDETVGVLRLR
ncbi:hypothetical protein PENTCL1PPCAC_19818, partial [Pristionchus entomophagus]